jgi:hypothetical protein
VDVVVGLFPVNEKEVQVSVLLFKGDGFQEGMYVPLSREVGNGGSLRGKVNDFVLGEVVNEARVECET